jgi:hypothetical protein
MMTGDGWQVCKSDVTVAKTDVEPGKTREHLAQEGRAEHLLGMATAITGLSRCYVCVTAYI